MNCSNGDSVLQAQAHLSAASHARQEEAEAKQQLQVCITCVKGSSSVVFVGRQRARLACIGHSATFARLLAADARAFVVILGLVLKGWC